MYDDITIDVSEIPFDLNSFLDEPIDFSVDTSLEEPKRQDFEEGEELLQVKTKYLDESILLDEKCEELAFRSLFPNGKFGYSCKRQKKLS